jgi:hypothetical protein
MTLQLVKPSLLRIAGEDLTEHNRSPVTVRPNRFERSIRTANATLRKWHVATKHEFDVSWEMVPSADDKTVDGKRGGKWLEDFYYSTPGIFTLRMVMPDGSFVTYNVAFTDFQKSVEKRWDGEYWNLSCSWEEA